jgi:hypothetical protein
MLKVGSVGVLTKVASEPLRAQSRVRTAGEVTDSEE